MARIVSFRYLAAMRLAEIEKQALALSEDERASLAVSLLETLSHDVEISDEEVMRRDADSESGRAVEISHDEFVRRVERERRR